MKKLIISLLFVVCGILNSHSQQINPYLTKLNTVLIKDNYSRALILCDSLVISDSTQLATSNYYKALIYKSMYRYKDALDHIKNAISLDSSNVDFQMELGRILYLRRKTSKADSVFTTIFNSDTTNLSAGIYLGRIKIKTEKYKEALDLYLKLASLDTMNSYFNKQIGFCYIMVGKSNKAISYLERAIFLDSTDIKPYEHISIVYQAKGEYDTAIYYMEKAIEQDMNNPKLYFILGDIHYSRNHYYQSIPNFHKAWELGLHDYETAAQLGLAYYHVASRLGGEYRDTIQLLKAKDFLTKAVEIEENNGALSYLGRTYIALEKPDKALPCFHKALSILRPEPLMVIQLYTDIAEVHELNSDYERAIESWLRIKEIEPGSNSLRFYTKEMFRLLYDSRVDMQIARIYETYLNKKGEALRLYENIVESSANIFTSEKSYAQKRIDVLKEELFFEKGVSKN